MSEKENKDELKKLKVIEVPKIEIMDDTSDDVKNDYFYRLMTKLQVEKKNLEIDIKTDKKEIKNRADDLNDENITGTAFENAVKYMFEINKDTGEYNLLPEDKVVNKKGLEADAIDTCMSQIRLALDGNENNFKGLDMKLLGLLKQKTTKEVEIKGIEDKMGECGVDKKAIKKMSVEDVKENDPNKKPPKDDFELVESIREITDTIIETKREVLPLIKESIAIEE